MTDPRDPEAIVLAWLEAGPTRLPETTRRAIAVTTRGNRQTWRRDVVPWRFPTMHLPRAVMAVALVGLLTVSLGGWYVMGPGSSSGVPVPGASPTPSPSPSPTPLSSAALLDTDSWTDYSSDRYGFSIRYPADWVPDPADHDWTLDEASDYGSTGHERFRHPGDDVGVSTWAYDPGPDISLDTTEEIVAWVEDFCGLAADAPCTGIADRAVPLCIEVRDCHPALLVPFANDTYAFIPGSAGDDRMIIAAVWRPEWDPSVSPYGGARQLLLAYLSTINGGGPAGVVPAPSATPTPTPSP